MKLVVLEGPAARPTFEIFNERTLIGRAPDCDVLVFDAQVSRHHALIVRRGNAYFLESLQHANPAVVNDRVMLTRRQLVDGDLIVLGSVVLEVDIPPLIEVDEQKALAAEAITDRAAPDLPAPDPGHEGPTPSPEAQLTPSPDERRTPSPEQRRPPRAAVRPALSPREQLRAMATRLGAAGQRLQTRLASQASLPVASGTDREAVARIVAEHEHLGGDAELARLATLLSERLSNQTDMRALYRLGAETAGLVAWTRLAERSMAEAVHLAEVLGVQQAV